MVRGQHRDRCVVVHVLEGHHSAGVGAVHHRGVDRVLDHALAVEVEVELHGPELRIDGILHVRIPRVLLELVLAGVELVLADVAEVLLLLLVGQEGVPADVLVEVLPVLRDAPGAESDLGLGAPVTSHDGLGHLVIDHHRESLLTLEAVGIVLYVPCKVSCHGLGPAAGEPLVQGVAAFRRGCGVDADRVEVEHFVVHQRGEVLLDPGDLAAVLAQLGLDVGLGYLEVDPVGHVGLGAALDYLGQVLDDALVGERGGGADIVGQRLHRREGVDLLVGLVDLAGEEDRGLSELRPGLDGLHVVIDDVALVGVHDAVQADAFGHDRRGDVLVEHLASLPLELVVGLAARLVDVVLDDLLLVEAVVALECDLADERRVVLELVEFGDVPLEEKLELVLVQELEVVLDDARDELVVALVALELGLAVGLAGDQNRVEPGAVLEDEEVRIEPELPPVVKHALRHCHEELEVDLSATLGDVLETGCHGRCVEHFSRYHFTCFFVLYGLHEEGVVAFCILDDDCVLDVLLRCNLCRHGRFLRHVEYHRVHLSLVDPGQRLLRAAGVDDHQQDEYGENEYFIFLKSHCLEDICKCYNHVIEKQEVAASSGRGFDSSEVLVSDIIQDAASPSSYTEVKVDVLADHDRVSCRQAQAEGFSADEVLRPESCLIEILELGLRSDPPSRIHVPWPVLGSEIAGNLLVHKGYLRFRTDFPWVELRSGKEGEMLRYADVGIKIGCTQVRPGEHVCAHRNLLCVRCAWVRHEKDGYYDYYVSDILHGYMIGISVVISSPQSSTSAENPPPLPPTGSTSGSRSGSSRLMTIFSSRSLSWLSSRSRSPI